MLRGALIAAAVMALAPGAHAYDVLYSGDVAMTHDAGTFGIEGAVLHFTADQWFRDGELTDGVVVDRLLRSDDDARYTGTFYPVRARYSPFRQLEVGGIGIFLDEKIENYADPATGLPDHKGLGVGDTWIWAKYNFSVDPLMTLRLAGKLPTGEDKPDSDELPTGSGQVDLDGAMMFGVPAGPGWINAAFGYRYRTERKADPEDAGSYSFKPGNEVHFFVGYTQLVGESFNVRVGADGSVGSDYEGGPGAESENTTTADTGVSLISFNPGIDYVTSSGIWIGLDLYYPIFGKNANALKGFGLSAGWGM
jgi:hypothetical protein